MKKTILMILLVLIPSVVALDLEDYPQFFFEEDEFDANIVVGSDAPPMDVTSAIELIPSLQQLTEDRIRGSTLDSDVDFIEGKNIISIGNACDNTITKQIMRLDRCEDGFRVGEAYIYLYENKGKAWLVIGAAEPEDTAKAARVLGNYHQYELEGDAVRVTGNEHPYSVVRVDLPREYEKEIPEVEEEEPAPEPEEYEETEEREDVRNEFLARKIEELTEEEEVPKPVVFEEEYVEEEVPEEAPIHQIVWTKFKNWFGWFFR